MKEIAIYGKGGIGKSTLSANISAALSIKGSRVLQIGCDPKHDSTRLLMKGKRITTVLDYIRTTKVTDYKLEDILFEGFRNIGCIEAGGPKPGVGCAGRGIITAFELLDKFHIKEKYDTVLYDVLGDVVCGGFAVPIRREYADTIFLVTSGEYMSIYAANNILRGIKNYDDSRCRVAGILFNSRNVKNEDAKIRAFAEAVGLPVFAKIPRDDVFAKAEREQCTVVELDENKEVRDIFLNIAERMIQEPVLYPANPLSDEALEELLMSEKILLSGKANVEQKRAKIEFEPAEANLTTNFNTVNLTAKDSFQENLQEQGDENNNYDAGYLSKNVLRDEPLHGCAFNGAMSMSCHILDAVILAHSPKNCIYISYQTLSSSGRRSLFERGTILPASLMPNLLSTDMTESDMVFGGTDKLLTTVEKIKQMTPKPKVIVIVSSCPAGIIGDDIDKAKELMGNEIPIVTIKADGNLIGDYLQGMLMAYTQLAKQAIDPDVKLQKDVVNIIFEKVVAKNTESNFIVMKKFLNQMGIRVNCRFLCNTNYEALRTFCSASLNLLAHKDYTGKILEEFFVKEYGCRFYPDQFPVGFDETQQWLRGVGAFFGKQEIAEKIIEENQRIYEERITRVRPALQGKRLMIMTYNHNLDWILRTALDAGMEVVKICVYNFSQDEGFRSKLPEIDNIPREEDYDRANRQRDLDAYRPDILLSNYGAPLSGENCIMDTIPMCPDNGFFSGLLIAERWAGLFHMDLEGEWKNDRHLFNKYYSR